MLRRVVSTQTVDVQRKRRIELQSPDDSGADFIFDECEQLKRKRKKNRGLINQSSRH
ncbi:hypothetical protein JOB18_016189 [Solea senegalensis]|uniref:Uncharacterized protein n=1 Tax=Solea senegalensis TaxID=28829 RepID=A0AAV6QEA9_SOLSE|nr:hypothetical protein JOB18_016189 [Solea senegalensis]